MIPNPFPNSRCFCRSNGEAVGGPGSVGSPGRHSHADHFGPPHSVRCPCGISAGFTRIPTASASSFCLAGAGAWRRSRRSCFKASFVALNHLQDLGWNHVKSIVLISACTGSNDAMSSSQDSFRPFIDIAWNRSLAANETSDLVGDILLVLDFTVSPEHRKLQRDSWTLIPHAMVRVCQAPSHKNNHFSIERVQFTNNRGSRKDSE